MIADLGEEGSRATTLVECFNPPVCILQTRQVAGQRRARQSFESFGSAGAGFRDAISKLFEDAPRPDLDRRLNGILKHPPSELKVIRQPGTHRLQDLPCRAQIAACELVFCQA